jgi:hypothetical protein
MTQTEVKVAYDNKTQYERITGYVIPGETLYAVFDCKGVGTGFVGITDQRVIFYDQEVLTLGKHKAMISIPYHQIIGVAVSDDGVVFRTSTIVLMTAAGKFSFEFRGQDKAPWAYRFIMNRILNHR